MIAIGNAKYQRKPRKVNSRAELKRYIRKEVRRVVRSQQESRDLEMRNKIL